MTDPAKHEWIACKDRLPDDGAVAPILFGAVGAVVAFCYACDGLMDALSPHREMLRTTLQ